VHDQSPLIINIALHTIIQNASKNHQIPNTQPKFMKSYKKFKNNKNKHRTIFRIFLQVYVVQKL